MDDRKESEALSMLRGPVNAAEAVIEGSWWSFKLGQAGHRRESWEPDRAGEAEEIV